MAGIYRHAPCPDQKQAQAILCLRNAVACCIRWGITVQRLSMGNGPVLRSCEFKATCIEFGIKHSFTRPQWPQTNGKAQRFMHSALCERGCGWTHQNSAHRSNALASRRHHCNWHRPHTGIGGIAPMSGRNASRNNLLTLHN
ncbi:integrase core domain-containing protein [Variovorax sp. YR566]|uniref:integrase core domain-containing protein n=1 Tax=Variovorax sp. YR566 TaxID=3450237 RepID=UPI003F805A66